MRDIDLILIHCSATPADRDIGAAEIRRWHTTTPPNGNGWADIGYHFVIRRNGTVETGRPLEQAGAHCAGRNSRSIGVCLVGGVDGKARARNNFTGPQWRALETLLIDLQTRFPGTLVAGHRDFAAKDCPSFDARAWWEGRREGRQ